MRLTVEAGAEVRAGGTYDGLFYPPTVLAGVTATMPAFWEEIFGPVAPVTVVEDDGGRRGGERHRVRAGRRRPDRLARARAGGRGAANNRHRARQ